MPLIEADTVAFLTTLTATSCRKLKIGKTKGNESNTKMNGRKRSDDANPTNFKIPREDSKKGVGGRVGD